MTQQWPLWTQSLPDLLSPKITTNQVLINFSRGRELGKNLKGQLFTSNAIISQKLRSVNHVMKTHLFCCIGGEGEGWSFPGRNYKQENTSINISYLDDCGVASWNANITRYLGGGESYLRIKIDGI